MESFQLMMAAGNYLPTHLGPWLTWMQVVLFLLPFAFVRHVAPRYLLLAQVLNTLTAYGVFVAEGHQVTRLFGLGHFFWLWPLWLMVRDVRSSVTPRLYRSYAAVAALTISISLVFDVRDTALWILGDRESILVDVPLESPLAEVSPRTAR